ncbi:gaba-b receptor [Anaeramoeba ignava]|uniref:Gaba-b receptor n=1 Tax=Anaeramoeba ignava TaxID=1746090 RepID=A0A9Q0LV75_ANAIG|nr:gaba-b receptor [Anaeramoeba ignava]
MFYRELLEETGDTTKRGLWIDYLVAVVTLLVSVLTLIGLGFFYYYRKYGAIKAKQPEIVLFFTIAGCVIASSSIIANNHFERPEGTFWAICALWRIWIQFFFGFSLWVNCLILRSFRLWLIFQRHIRPGLSVFYKGLAILQAPWLVFSIFVTIFKGVYWDDEKDKCKSTTASLVLLAILGVANILLLIFTVIKIRKITEEYSGYKEIRGALLLGVISAVIGFGFWLLRKPINNVSDDDAGSTTNRVILTLDITVCVALLFWVPNLTPIIRAFKKDEEYVKKIREKVRADVFKQDFISKEEQEKLKQKQVDNNNDNKNNPPKQEDQKNEIEVKDQTEQLNEKLNQSKSDQSDQPNELNEKDDLEMKDIK